MSLSRNNLFSFKMIQLLSFMAKGMEQRVARYVWRQKLFHTFHSFCKLIWFLEWWIPFPKYSIRSPVRKVDRLLESFFLVWYTFVVRTIQFFPPAQNLIGQCQFKMQSHWPYAKQSVSECFTVSKLYSAVQGKEKRMNFFFLV